MKEEAREKLFWSKVDVKSNEECWLWKAHLDHKGYGQFWDGKTQARAHRFAWKIHYKQEVPSGMNILHHCDNPACVNHHHLYCGTQSDNMIDKVVRGRSAGYDHSHLRISSEKIKLIEKLHKIDKLSTRKIAKIVSIHSSTVWNYVKNYEVVT